MASHFGNSPAVDQIGARHDDVATLCAGNGHLTTDPLIAHVVEHALRGGQSDTAAEFDVAFGSSVLPFLPRIFRSRSGMCSLCAVSLADGGRLWVGAGASIVEIGACADCRAEFDRSTSPAPVWR